MRASPGPVAPGVCEVPVPAVELELEADGRGAAGRRGRTVRAKRDRHHDGQDGDDRDHRADAQGAGASLLSLAPVVLRWWPRIRLLGMAHVAAPSLAAAAANVSVI